MIRDKAFIALSRNPKASGVVTELGYKTKPRLLKTFRTKRVKGIAAGLILVLALIIPNNNVIAPSSDGRFMTVSISGSIFMLEIADTPETRARGLGNRPGIKDDEGMLFVFDVPGIECFWMKDVNFPIDILWFDSEKRLVHHVSGLSPDTYPKSFCPPSLVQYVIELPGGTIERLQLRQSDILKVENL